MVAARPQAAGRHTERDLAAAVRAELAAIEPARQCCRAAERAGLGAAAEGRARTPLIGRLAVRLDHDLPRTVFDWGHAAEHCRLSYLRGLLLTGGSLSVGPSGTHLEIAVAPALLEPLERELGELGLAGGARMRRGRGVLTWKDAETIVALLRRLGATTSALELEARLIGRQLHGHLNRVVNAEHANLRRAVSAARWQLADIATLEGRGRLRHLPVHVRRIAAARRRLPEATLSELASELELSRGQVQRAFELIESTTLHEETDD